MKMKLAMKTTIVALLTFISCKKDAVTPQVPTTAAKSKLKVENGIIHFKDNQEFFQTMLVINSLPESKRTEWEKSNGFTSLRSKYDGLNRELDKMEAIRDEAGFYAVRDKYKNIAVWYDDSSYQINCSGIMESSVVNADGYVRVGDNLLNFKEDQIASVPVNADKNARSSGAATIIWKKPFKCSYRQESSRQSAGRSGGRVITGAPAPANSFTESHGFLAPKVSAGIGTGYVQYRLFNVSMNNKKMGFVSIVFWAEHRNWIGINRRVKSSGLGHTFQHNVKLAASGTANLSYPVNVVHNGLGSTYWAFGPNWNTAPSENNEVVIIASAELRNVSSVPGLNSFYPSKFNFADQYITESDPNNDYWQAFEPYLFATSFTFNTMVWFRSMGDGIKPEQIDHYIEYI